MDNDNYAEIELDFADEDGNQAHESVTSGKDVREELFQRCRAAGIHCADQEMPAGSADYQPVKVAMPSGRTTREIVAYSDKAVQGLLSVPFEKYRFLDGYDAICSYQDGTIEAEVSQATRPTRPSVDIIERLFRVRYRPRSRDESFDEVQLVLPSQNQAGVSVRLGSGSMTFNALTRLNRFGYGQGYLGQDYDMYIRPTLTLTISGLNVSQHDQAVQWLNKLASSLFLEVDLTFDLALSLARHRTRTRQRLSQRKKPDINSLQFPKSEYDEVPMSLYWYGRSAVGLPLLQFLAFYQVLEFYFPTYSDREALGHLQNIVKDPTFNAHNPSDIARLLQAVKSHSGRGFGDERHQLVATLRGCLDANELWDFARADEDRQKALSSKGKLSTHKLPLTGTPVDIRESVASRIYDIRCKIVHTKNGADETEVELLLPDSEEADSLGYDIELVQYIARRVLIANSRPLNLLM